MKCHTFSESQAQADFNNDDDKDDNDKDDKDNKDDKDDNNDNKILDLSKV